MYLTGKDQATRNRSGSSALANRGSADGGFAKGHRLGRRWHRSGSRRAERMGQQGWVAEGVIGLWYRVSSNNKEAVAHGISHVFAHFCVGFHFL